MDDFEKELLDALRGFARREVAEAAEQALGNPLAGWCVDFKALFDGDHEDEQWLLEPMLAKGRAHALYAGAKVGKSWVMLYLAAALASGRPVLRRPAGEPVHVLYVDYEMTPQDLADRLEDFGYGPDDAETLNEHLHYVLLPSIPALDTEEGGDLLARAAVACSAELVVIDTMMRAVEGEENSSDTFNAFYRNTGLRLKALGVTWARLDHAGKDPTKGQRGSSAKDGDVDLVLRLDRVEGGVTVKATHRRIGWYPELTSLMVTGGKDAGEAVRIQMLGGDDRLYVEGTKEAAETLAGLGLPMDAGRRKFRLALKEKGVKMSDRLLADGLAWWRGIARATPLEDVLSQYGAPGGNHSRHPEKVQVEGGAPPNAPLAPPNPSEGGGVRISRYAPPPDQAADDPW